MNCDNAIEFLPWLLNGTLEAGERDEVRRHLATCESCRATLNDTREAWTIFGQHLPSDALVALAYGETPQGVDPEVAERHLAACPECAAELELARTSRRLEEDDKIAVFPGTRARQEKSADRDRRWRAAAVAAGFTGLVALSGWLYEFQQAGDLAERLAQRPAQVQEARPAPPPVHPTPGISDQQAAELKRQINEFQQTQQQMKADLSQANERMAKLSREALEPQLNAQVVESPEVVRDANGAGAKEIVLPSDRPALLSMSTDSEQAVRDIELMDSSGRILFSKSGLLEKNREYTVSFRRGSLKPGRYTIQLYENENGKRVKRESYIIHVE